MEDVLTKQKPHQLMCTSQSPVKSGKIYPSFVYNCRTVWSRLSWCCVCIYSGSGDGCTACLADGQWWQWL